MTPWYLAFVILLQFSPTEISKDFSRDFFGALESAPRTVTIEFDDLKGIDVGTSVLIGDTLAGTVADITRKETSAPKEESERFAVSLQISSSFSDKLRKGTVGMITGLMLKNKDKPKTVVELVVPQQKNLPAIQDQEALKGFSSYPQYWSSATS